MRAAGIAILVMLLAFSTGAAESDILIPGGDLVGVAIQSKGLMFIGASDLGATPSPARQAGLKNGDIIETANGHEITGVKAFSETVGTGTKVALGVIRNGKRLTLDISPMQDPRDGSYRIGAWVRESAAGVGTLTFINPKTGGYAALGHAITDPDTLTAMPVREGYIYESDLSSIVRGKVGSPGELAGDFVSQNRRLGTITHNGESGIGGIYTAAEAGSPLFPNGLPAAESSEIVVGKAQLICTVDQRGPRLFDMEITEVDISKSSRNLKIRITDEELLGLTGGIVQGMSGAPIIQNGRLVGSITHVLVNDPKRGYGITKERMVTPEAQKIDNAA